MKNRPKIELTLFGWQDELGIEVKTIRSRLIKAGVEIIPHQKLSAYTVLTALSSKGEKDEALTRKAMAEAESIERENKKEDGLLIDLPEADKAIWSRVLSPLRTELETMPDRLAGLVNPDEQERAHGILQDWVEQTKKQILEGKKK